MADERLTGAASTAPAWAQSLDGVDIVFGDTALPQFRSQPWTIEFSLPTDLSELASVVDPLLLIYSGAASVREIESKMDLLVAMAREQGRSWTEIGRALGVTKQTAWARMSRVVAEGKTKIIVDAGQGEVLVHSKDDITAGNGVKHDVIAGKARASTRTTINIFQLLARHGIPTHFVDAVDDVTFRARDVDMIPLELVVRRYATGSFVDRFPAVAEGERFEVPVFELFEKDDANHDPLLEFDFTSGLLRRFVPSAQAATQIGASAAAGDLLTEEPLGRTRYSDMTPEIVARLRQLSTSTFAVIEEAWAHQGGVYIDLKIECGFDRETGDLLVADVIDSDSGRLRIGEVDMSKQSYRDGTATLPELMKKFDEVAALTERFSG